MKKGFVKKTVKILVGILITLVLLMAFTGNEIHNSKEVQGEFTQKKDLYFTSNDTLRLKVVKNHDLSNGFSFTNSKEKRTVIFTGGKKLFSPRVSLDIEPSKTTQVYLITKKTSEGNDKENAIQSAQKIGYDFSISDKEIVFNHYFTSNAFDAFKNEQVQLTLCIPPNVTLLLDDSTSAIIKNIPHTNHSGKEKKYITMTSNELKQRKPSTKTAVDL